MFVNVQALVAGLCGTVWLISSRKGDISNGINGGTF
jgi:hypothetical protein